MAWGNNKADQVAREMAKQEPILVTGLQETATGNWDRTKGWPHLECPNCLKDKRTMAHLRGKLYSPENKEKTHFAKYRNGLI